MNTITCVDDIPLNSDAYKAVVMPRKYKQHDSILMLATGIAGAYVYMTKQRRVYLTHTIPVPSCFYSDTAGGFTAQFNEYETVQKYSWIEIEQQFLEKIRTYLIELNIATFQAVYVFAPAHAKNSLLTAFPHPLLEKSLLVEQYNVHQTQPLALLKKARAHEIDCQNKGVSSTKFTTGRKS